MSAKLDTAAHLSFRSRSALQAATATQAAQAPQAEQAAQAAEAAQAGQAAQAFAYHLHGECVVVTNTTAHSNTKSNTTSH